MSELRELYQEVILDHGKRPRNFKRNDQANHTAKGYNPLCGDELELFLCLSDGGVLEDICFQGSGCAISTASASMMTQILRGKSVAQAQELFERFHELIAGDEAPEPEQLGKLAVFAGVREFPNRVKCATLAWHTLIAALEHHNQPVSTE